MDAKLTAAAPAVPNGETKTMTATFAVPLDARAIRNAALEEAASLVERHAYLSDMCEDELRAAGEAVRALQGGSAMTDLNLTDKTLEDRLREAAQNDAIGYAIKYEAADRARIEELEKALREAADQFDFYAKNHRAKGTADGDEKAATNEQWAERLRALGRPA